MKEVLNIIYFYIVIKLISSGKAYQDFSGIVRNKKAILCYIEINKYKLYKSSKSEFLKHWLK